MQSSLFVQEPQLPKTSLKIPKSCMVIRMYWSPLVFLMKVIPETRRAHLICHCTYLRYQQPCFVFLSTLKTPFLHLLFFLLEDAGNIWMLLLAPVQSTTGCL